jgi:hypothetical protein
MGLLFLLSQFSFLVSFLYNSPRINMSLHSDTLFLFRANPRLFLLLNAASFAEKLNIPIRQYPMGLLFLLSQLSFLETFLYFTNVIFILSGLWFDVDTIALYSNICLSQVFSYCNVKSRHLWTSHLLIHLIFVYISALLWR